MSLGIYKTPNPHSVYSTDGSHSNALALSFDGVTGQTIIQKYYVRNNNSSYYYTGITLQPICSSGTNIINGTNGYVWKLIAGDTKPLTAQWGLVGAGNQITIPNIGSAGNGDIATYEPFWLFITVPQGAPVASYRGIKLRLDYTETAV